MKVVPPPLPVNRAATDAAALAATIGSSSQPASDAAIADARRSAQAVMALFDMMFPPRKRRRARASRIAG